MSRQDVLRTKFSHAMSQLYQAEVPLYRKLVGIVQKQNHLTTSDLDDGGGRLEVERHGAIRLGTPHELHTISRVFGLMGMSPVGYYDLSSTGIPLHATAFRPTTAEALSINPFRVFTTVLRVEMLSKDVQELVSSILSKRKIFAPELAQILDTMENNDHWSDADQEAFIQSALKTFAFRHSSTVTHHDYVKLQGEHPILADIAAFSTAHINHLTPRALDITAVQKDMVRQGIGAKSHIEGPPERACPILLRQTSFMAVDEAISFLDEDAEGEHGRTGLHRARFGEVEQRGAAMTRKGLDWYNLRLERARARAAAESERASYEEILEDEFKDFPDDWETLRRQGLAFFQYRLADGASKEVHAARNAGGLPRDVDALVAKSILTYKPIVYEDFLPISAAGIFQSNLDGQSTRRQHSAVPGDDREGFEGALGKDVLDEIDQYEVIQNQSLQECYRALGID